MASEIGEVPTVKTRKRKPRMADQGDDLDVSRALANSWDTAWRGMERAECRGSSTIDLYLNWNAWAHAGGLGSPLFWPACAAIVAADVLETAGYRVAVHACSTKWRQSERHDFCFQKITVKDASEPLRVDTLVAILGSDIGVRAARWRADMTIRLPFSDGRGLPAGWTETQEILARVGRAIDPDSAVLLGAPFDRDACITEVKRILNAFQPQ